MEIQAYELFVPYMIDDMIKIENTDSKYKILDILHTYSADKKTIVSVDFVLLDIKSNKEITIPYNKYSWEIIKDE